MPEIPACSQTVTYKGPCGHQTKRLCSHSFEFASGIKSSPECNEQKSLTCFVCCSGQLDLPCWLTTQLAAIKIWPAESLPVKKSNGIITVNECDLETAELAIAPLINNARALKYLRYRFNCKIQLIVFRLCSSDHITTISCNQLFEKILKKEPLKECITQVNRVLACKHTAKVACYAKNRNPPPICSLPIDNTFTYPCGIHSVKPKVCSEYTALLEATNPKCAELISCSRRRCGHTVVAACHFKAVIQGVSADSPRLDTSAETNQKIVKSNMDYYETEQGISKCTELVSYRYNDCKHLRSDMKCFEAFSWAANNELELSCDKIVKFVSPVCGHDLEMKCNVVDLMKDWKPWVNINKPNVTKYVSRFDENKEPVHAYSINEKDLNFKLTLPRNFPPLAKCPIKFTIVRTCGHEFESTCSNVYLQSYPPCNDLVVVKCPKSDCGHEKKVGCHKHAADKRTNKPFYCMNQLEKVCQKCNVNKVEVQCCKTTVECHDEVSLTLEKCGHEISWKCGVDEDPRLNNDRCQYCVYEKWEELINYKSCDGEDVKLMEKFLAKTKESLKNYDNQAKFIDSDFMKDLNDHVICRPMIMRRYLDHAKYKGALIDLPPIFSDDKLYVKVFVQIKAPKEEEKPTFEQKPTLYGKGYEMTELTGLALSKCKPDDNGLIHVLIGVAFRFNMDSYSEPFCAQINKRGNLI